jgi:NAD-dependent DNA ligase
MIGWGRSGKVAEYFKNVLSLSNAKENQWTEIEGIGKTIASRVVNAIKTDDEG